MKKAKTRALLIPALAALLIFAAISPQIASAAAQLAALRRELRAALDGLDALAHLCSVQQLGSRVEEGVSAALFILDAAEAAGNHARGNDEHES